MAKRYKNSAGPFSLPNASSSVAMMPQEKINRSISDPYMSLPEVYEDTITGVDAQIRYDNAQMRKGFKPTKV